MPLTRPSHAPHTPLPQPLILLTLPRPNPAFLPPSAPGPPPPPLLAKEPRLRLVRGDILRLDLNRLICEAVLGEQAVVDPATATAAATAATAASTSHTLNPPLESPALQAVAPAAALVGTRVASPSSASGGSGEANTR